MYILPIGICNLRYNTGKSYRKLYQREAGKKKERKDRLKKRKWGKHFDRVTKNARKDSLFASIEWSFILFTFDFFFPIYVLIFTLIPSFIINKYLFSLQVSLLGAVEQRPPLWNQYMKYLMIPQRWWIVITQRNSHNAIRLGGSWAGEYLLPGFKK